MPPAPPLFPSFSGQGLTFQTSRRSLFMSMIRAVCFLRGADLTQTRLSAQEP